MTETFAALLLAHAAADFLLQSAGMARGKQARGPGAFAAHLAIVAACAALALGAVTGPAWAAVAALTAAHGATDLAKTFAPAGRLWPFLADQAAHLAALVLTAALAPGLWDSGAWAAGLPGRAGGGAGLWSAGPGTDWMPPAMALAAGLILAVRAGGFAVGLMMQRWEGRGPQGLPDGGRMIGLLERGLIFVLVLAGQPAGVGFLIAAKSVLRYEATREDQAAAEYVIIGTLASFGWALAVAYATVLLLAGLHPLGIPPANP